jgi:hypothetical protein
MLCRPANSRPVLLTYMSTKAQLFHAYLGALFMEDGLAAAERWVRSLMHYQAEQEETSTMHGSPTQKTTSLPLPDIGTFSPTEPGSPFTSSSLRSDDSTTSVGQNPRKSHTPSANARGNQTPSTNIRENHTKSILISLLIGRQAGEHPPGPNLNPNRMRNPADATQSSPPGTSQPSTTLIYTKGVNALFRLNELVQQKQLRNVEWMPESHGQQHNLL